MTLNATLETPVLIVGAGPVGLALAADLGQRGVPAVVVDQRDGHPDHPRAARIDVRTMELLRRWGISAAVREAAPDLGEARDTIYATSLRGYELARIEPARSVSAGLSPEVALSCNQMWLLPVLRELASSQRDIRIVDRWQLERVTQRGDCVLAEGIDLESRSRRRIAAQILVDCSGEDSIVRTAIGISMSEPAHAERRVSLYLRSADLHRHHDRGPFALARLVDTTGIDAELEPIDGRAHFRLCLINRDSEQVGSSDAVRRVLGRFVEHIELSRCAWTIRNSVANRYRDDRIWLAGDAAHQIGPVPGLSLGTGLGDAVDLAWKIEGRLAGWGLSGLIESYEQERCPVAAQCARLAESLLDPERTLRSHPDIALDTLIGRAARKSMESRARQHASLPDTDTLMLGVDYAASPLIAVPRNEPGPPPPQHGSRVRPGLRAPHVRLPGGASTLDLYGRGFVLLRLGPRAPEPGGFDRAFSHRGLPLSFRSFDDPSISGRHDCRLMLVRPDGHIAWMGDEPPHDPLRLADRVRGAFN